MSDVGKYQNIQLNKEAAKRGRKVWMDNENLVKRALEIHEKYTRRIIIPDIAKQHNLTVVQVRRDLKRAVEYKAAIFAEAQIDVLGEQLGVRQAISRDIHASLTDLRAAGEIPTDNQALRSVIAKSEAELYARLMDNEKAIEELLGLRHHKQNTSLPVEPPTQPQLREGPPVILIDARKDSSYRILENDSEVAQ